MKVNIREIEDVEWGKLYSWEEICDACGVKSPTNTTNQNPLSQDPLSLPNYDFCPHCEFFGTINNIPCDRRLIDAIRKYASEVLGFQKEQYRVSDVSDGHNESE